LSAGPRKPMRNCRVSAVCALHARECKGRRTAKRADDYQLLRRKKRALCTSKLHKLRLNDGNCVLILSAAHCDRLNCDRILSSCAMRRVILLLFERNILSNILEQPHSPEIRDDVARDGRGFFGKTFIFYNLIVIARHGIVQSDGSPAPETVNS